jgi:glycosyltransferase involved in cell wall biosynthesis
MRAILEAEPKTEILFFQIENDAKIVTPYIFSETMKFGTTEFTRITCHIISINPDLNQKRIKEISNINREFIIEQAKLLHPDVIQASDVREIKLCLSMKKRLKCRAIYDSHEDYSRQIIDYADSIKLRTLKEAFVFWFSEMRRIRQFDAVFCTDDYLHKKYRQPLYGARNVFLLRNFPYKINMMVKETHFETKNELKLVYIGGVNKYRGVIECAEFCERFNTESNNNQKLHFTIYGPNNEIIESLKKRDLIQHFEWIEYIDLMNALSQYDVGVCLWHPIPKFYRNLPLKNFDYMAAGLPILTSNFGNLAKYLNESESGIGIEPTKYDEFKKAIITLFEPKIRFRFSQSGQKWVSKSGNFKNESKEYVSIILGHKN